MNDSHPGRCKARFWAIAAVIYVSLAVLAIVFLRDVFPGVGGAVGALGAALVLAAWTNARGDRGATP
ncbi:hypothetical protein [Actinokineospora globicatena]|uniref:hypothetical protein n=1 Tax=Actinokineospora globicatena TaxID=103729 RepID=UPI0020A5BADD|nr:hypothetical protein [Actinokineospora globicatena]MCP2306114.1 hypothetical protein [Actinokineospora globicatena]GLW80011.1 hypothetical protein Aglo01_44920 [Actinokineospora globicatena]GLW86840.1 hypothetical protein Aglo02_44790 [Actinokineospora globicatena]